MSDQDSAYGKPKSAVGYGRPPVNRQFKPGQSGNPRGRPKGQKNFATMFAETLNEKIPIRGKNGKRHWVTRKQAMCQVLTNKAISGDPKAISVAFQLADKLRALEYQPPASSVSHDLDERLKELSQSMARLAPQPPPEPDLLQETQDDAPASDSAKEK
jgi:hypothetical protein